MQQRTQAEVEAFIANLHQEGVVTPANCAHLTNAMVQYCRGKTVSVGEIETTPAETLNSDDDNEDEGNADNVEKRKGAYRGETVEVKAETEGGDYEVTQGGLPESMDMMGQRIVITFDDDGSTRDVVDADTRARHVRCPYVNEKEISLASVDVHSCVVGVCRSPTSNTGSPCSSLLLLFIVHLISKV